MSLLEVKYLCKNFIIDRNFFGKPTKVLQGVKDVSLNIPRQQTLGLVGESGCGKSTLGRTIIGLYAPTSGEILFEGKALGKNHKDIQMIFQDPYASLNPRMTVADIIGEPLDIHHLHQGKQRQERIYELLELVGLSHEQANRYPHEFSGGQRQRIGIARALACEPKLIICDEPISALDVSIQAQVINLLKDLQKKLGLSYLFIAHDLAMVQYLSHEVAVMYLGSIVEWAKVEELFSNPLHPYTQNLLAAIPVPDPRHEKAKASFQLTGELPNPLEPPQGCPFHTRCPKKMDICAREVPQMQIIEGHQVSCHLYDKTKKRSNYSSFFIGLSLCTDFPSRFFCFIIQNSHKSYRLGFVAIQCVYIILES